jgi:hypothetical protein
MFVDERIDRSLSTYVDLYLVSRKPFRWLQQEKDTWSRAFCELRRLRRRNCPRGDSRVNG